MTRVGMARCAEIQKPSWSYTAEGPACGLVSSVFFQWMFVSCSCVQTFFSWTPETFFSWTPGTFLSWTPGTFFSWTPGTFFSRTPNFKNFFTTHRIQRRKMPQNDSIRKIIVLAAAAAAAACSAAFFCTTRGTGRRERLLRCLPVHYHRQITACGRDKDLGLLQVGLHA